MKEPAFISKDPPINPGMDYAFLKTEGVRLLQRMSSDQWTDYNEHDPGVTTLEQLCYALTELSYRAELPMRDLLTAPNQARISFRKHGLFEPFRVLPCNAVTIDDYRRLIVDTVQQVRNVWISPHKPKPGSNGENGQYDLTLHVPTVHEHRHEEIVKRVRRVYGRHRNLCEDIRSIHVLKPLRTVVRADVAINPGQLPEQVLASVLFEAGKLLAPEIARVPLSDLLDAGKSPSEIFDGPLLRKGFIDDSELQPRASSVPVNQLIRAMASATGVVNVGNVDVHTAHSHAHYSINESVPVPDGHFLHLDTGDAHRDPAFSIHLTRNGILCHPDMTEVQRELQQLWAIYRRTFLLAPEYEEFFPLPEGSWRDFARYYSIQNQYPGVYGIGAYGLPKDAAQSHKAQARQFKGYLLPFEQLMTDYFAQLSNLGEVFNIMPGHGQTAFVQSLFKSVPDIEPLIQRHPGEVDPAKIEADYMRRLQEIVAGEQDGLAKRSHYLEFLLAMYANELHISKGAGGSSWHGHETHGTRESQEKLLRARLELLQVLVRSTHRRGAGLDYRAPVSRYNIAGMEYKCRIELELDLEERGHPHEHYRQELEAHNVTVVKDAHDNHFQTTASHTDSPGQNLRILTSFDEPEDVPERAGLLHGKKISEDFLSSAQDPGNLYLHQGAEETSVTLLWRNRGSAGYIHIDVFRDHPSALREAHALVRALRRLYRSRARLYIVEHNLLRFAIKDHRDHHHHHHEHPAAFPYNLALTAVVSLPHGGIYLPNNRKIIEEIVRQNTPAHLSTEVIFLDHSKMQRFEKHYWSWRRALRRDWHEALMRSSARLVRFLERHTHHVEGEHADATGES